MATKNRDGKPTEFQKRKLRDLGYNKRVKTYREAENALKRLYKASKHDNKANECASKKTPSKGVFGGFLAVTVITPIFRANAAVRKGSK